MLRGCLWLFLGLVLVDFSACTSDSTPGEAVGAVGESCTARRDCASGLECVHQVCVDPHTKDAGVDPTGGALGEACRARNDCAVGLACVGDVCVTGNLGIPVTGKSCVRVECTTKDDCCSNFVPSPNCPTYQQDCSTDPTSCITYHSLCDCNRDCVDSICKDTPPPCSSNQECASLVTPFCVNGACAECAQPGDCAGQNDRCVNGTCKAPCTEDAQCALLEACQNGECVRVGCSTDRECFFMLNDPRATCSGGDCQIPCSIDADCARQLGEQSFQVCQAKKCVFVGCNTDAECRAFLGLSAVTSNVKAECRAESTGTDAGAGTSSAPPADAGHN